MGVISGSGGAVNGMVGVSSWEIGYTDNIQDFATAKTKGAMARIVGNKDWSGNFVGYGHTPSARIGQLFAFIGGVTQGAAVNGASCPASGALCSGATVNVDIEGGKPVNHTVDFAGALALTLGTVDTGVIPADVIAPSIGCTLKLDPIGNGAEFPVSDVRTMSLAISMALKEYASSGTEGKIKRVAGNIDASLTFNVYTDNFALATLPVEGTLYKATITFPDTKTWIIDAMIAGEASGIGANIEAGDLVSPSYTLSFAALYWLTSAWVVGSIIAPDASYWYGSP